LLDRVTKRYGRKGLALDRVSLHIASKEFVLIVGSSGAGKSTLLKLLTREEKPTSGKIVVGGIDYDRLKDKEVPLLRRKIGTIFQDFKLLESKTVYENVAIALEVADTPNDELREIVPNVLDIVGLLDKKNHLPHQLSGGEKQRVSIARALAHEPDILVADEPTGMIDPDSGEKIMNILDLINQRGTTILMATHDKNIVNKWKKRVIRISNGKIVSDKEKGTYNE